MRLTKSDIHYIDNDLKTKGITYWDIRLEMIDHIACQMESKEGHYDFESLFEHTVYELGWSNNLKPIQNKRLKEINVTLRRKFFKNFLNLFLKTRSLVFVMMFVCAYYLIFQICSVKLFNVISFALFGLPIICFTIHYAATTLKFKKSGYLLYGYHYVIFSVLILNVFYQFPKPDGIIEVSLATQQNIVFFTTIINVLFMYSGIKVYLAIANQYKEMQKSLISN